MPEKDATVVGVATQLDYFARQLGASIAAHGEQIARSSAFLPPGVASSAGDLQRILAALASANTAVLATGGEFRQTVALYRSLGFDDAHPLLLAIHYRSYLVDSWRNGGDGVATALDPFGPGWRASWGDRLVAPVANGNPVTRIDDHGVQWTHAQVETWTVEFPDVAPLEIFTNRRFDAQAGKRLVHEHHVIGNQVVGIWFLEWPDRTRIQYAATPASGLDLVISRQYRGAFAQPDWQITYSYGSLGQLLSVTDARGIVYTLHWIALGSAWRVQRISVSGPWPANWAALDVQFEYEQSVPYRLQRVRKPVRAFLDDLDRNGMYEPEESLTGELATFFEYHSAASNRLLRIWDNSAGFMRVLAGVTYDAAVPWRVHELRIGPSGAAPPGQEQRLHTFAYESQPVPATTWTDPRGVIRRYEYSTGFGGSPRQWRVTRLDETPGPNDPRPSGDPFHHSTLSWTFAWNCGCGQLLEVRMPSGLRHVFSYDSEGRGFVTSSGVIPIGGQTPQQVRSWTYRPWNEADYRLASRLASYADAHGKSGLHSFSWDGAAGGYQVTGSFAGVELFRLQEDGGGRLVWFEEGPFSVLDGGTSRSRRAFTFGGNPTAADWRLVNKMQRVSGSAPYPERTFTYVGPGWIASITDEKGRVETYACDSTGWLRTVTFPVTGSGRGSATYGATLQLQYERHGSIAVVSRSAHDDLGSPYPKATVDSERVYDYFGRPWREAVDRRRLDAGASDALWVEYEFDRSNRLVQVREPGGRETEYLHDDHDDLYQLRGRLDGSTWSTRTFGWHVDGALARVVDATGLEARIDDLDSWGRPRQVHLPGDKHFWLTRDGENRLTQREYRVGQLPTPAVKRTEAWQRNDLGQVLTVTTSAPGLAVADVRTMTYNGAFRVATSTDGDGRGVRYGFDVFGRWISKQDTLLGTDGNRWRAWRDALGNVTRIDEVLQRQTGTQSWQPITYRTDFALDAWDRVARLEIWGSAGAVQATRFRAYDSLGNQTWEKDAVGKEHRRAFDALGRIVDEWLHQRDPQAPAIHHGLTYDDDPADPLLSARMTRTDGVGNVGEARYDLLGRLVERRLPGYDAQTGALRWRYTYDLEGRLTEWIDGNGVTVRQVLDAEKRMQRRAVMNLPTNGVVLSRLATQESWTYDDFDRVGLAQTWWNAYPQFESGELLNLIESVWSHDGIGRQQLSEFRYLDDADPGYSPLAVKQHLSGYAKPGGEDAWFRRSLTTSSGWKLGYSPDATGKLAAMSLEGPGVANQPLADWWHEGARPVRRSFVPGSDADQRVATVLTYDALRQLTRAKTDFGPGGIGTTLFDVELLRDMEGNVTQHRYSTMSGRAGDWFQLDGWDRLQESKLGVPSFSGGYGQASVYDRKITYALDMAHNRQSVVEEQGSETTTTPYVRRPGTNEYQDVGAQNWVYDGNGNLLSDGFFVYVYDHLDRLSEVWLLTYPGGATVQTSQGTKVLRFGVEIQRRRSGHATKLSTSRWRELVGRGQARVDRERAKLAAPTLLVPATANAGTESGSVDEPVPVLVAYYGYDPTNRRVAKARPEATTYYSWDGWKLAESYDGQFQSESVRFDGPGLDEHLGWAVRDPNSGQWTRYGAVQGQSGSVTCIVDAAGLVVERYEYDPYGRMLAFDPTGAPRGTNPTIPGSMYGFTGRQIDPESGLLYYRNRYYSPAAGRFLTKDSLGPWADEANGGNEYAYAGSAPARRSDPLGLLSIVDIGGFSDVIRPVADDPPGASSAAGCEKQKWTVTIWIRDADKKSFSAGHAWVTLRGPDGQEHSFGMYSGGPAQEGDSSSNAGSSGGASVGSSAGASAGGNLGRHTGIGTSAGGSSGSSAGGSGGASAGGGRSRGSGRTWPLFNPRTNGHVSDTKDQGQLGDEKFEIELDKEQWDALKAALDKLVGRDLPYDLRGGNGDMKGAENCTTFVIFVIREATQEGHPGLPGKSKQGGYATPKGLGEALKDEAKKEKPKIRYGGRLVLIFIRIQAAPVGSAQHFIATAA
jgi:RHS repeat-associated protein